MSRTRLCRAPVTKLLVTNMMTSMAIQVPINLATEPFRRHRPVLVASAALGLLLATLLGFDAKTIVFPRHHQSSKCPTARHHRRTGKAERAAAEARERRSDGAQPVFERPDRSQSHQLDETVRGSGKSGALQRTPGLRSIARSGFG